MDSEQFIQELSKQFHLKKNDVLDKDYEGLFSLQMNVFKDYTQSCIDNGD